MEPKRTKYDTNPLDEEVADRATDAFSASQPAPTNEVQGGPTRPINADEHDTVRAYAESEAPTRHIGDKVTSYPSVFVPPPPKPATTYKPPRAPAAQVYQPPPGPPPNIYQPPLLPLQQPGENHVSGLGIQERWAVLIPYLPSSWLAVVAAIIELLLVPRTESRVRFHAAQAMVLHLGVIAISMLLTFAAFVSGRFTGASVFNLATFVFFVIAMIRVFQGK